MKRYIYTILFIGILAISTTSCRSRQQIIRSDTHVVDKTPGELFYDIIANHFPYNTFSARLNLSLSSGMSSRGNIRIIRDQALQVSVQMPLIGVVEVFRLYVDPHSVVIVDRMNRRYVHENIAALQEVFPAGFDFYTLQALFTNALFVSNRNHVERRDYRNFRISLTDDMQYFMTARDRRSGIEYSFIVNGYDRVTRANLVHGGSSLVWNYEHFAMVGNHAFPHRMNVSVATEARNASAEITFSNIATNETFQLAPNIPNGFTRTSISEVMRLVTTLM